MVNKTGNSMMCINMRRVILKGNTVKVKYKGVEHVVECKTYEEAVKGFCRICNYLIKHPETYLSVFKIILVTYFRFGKLYSSVN